MNGREANTFFAVVANWRGKSLSDDERAAWKYAIWRMDADELEAAIAAWGQGHKRNFRPSIGDLRNLMPGSAPAEHYGDFRSPHPWERDTLAGVAAEKVYEQCAAIGIGRRAKGN